MTPYDRHRPYLASLRSRHCLNGTETEKAVYHLVLDLGDSALAYKAGDSVGVMPVNDSEVVGRTLAAMKATGEEAVIDQGAGETLSLRRFLSDKANLSRISRALVQVVCSRQPHPEKRAVLERLLGEGNKDALRQYLADRQVWDFLLENEEVTLEPFRWKEWLGPLLPRLYSIASSKQVVGNEVHLTVAKVQYVSRGHQRHGVCTDFLCRRVALNQPAVPLYIQAAKHFCLPADPRRDLIMVGAGTGVAPFRAFMQERTVGEASGRHWLFFGARQQASDFYYRDYWHQLTSRGVLRVDTAFSRDQTHKIYVQHRLLERGEEVWRWLQEGAYFYVCGDAAGMAREVDQALHQIAQQQGSLSSEAAGCYVQALRAEGRYLKDVY